VPTLWPLQASWCQLWLLPVFPSAPAILPRSFSKYFLPNACGAESRLWIQKGPRSESESGSYYQKMFRIGYDTRWISSTISCRAGGESANRPIAAFTSDDRLIVWLGSTVIKFRRRTVIPDVRVCTWHYYSANPTSPGFGWGVSNQRIISKVDARRHWLTPATARKHIAYLSTFSRWQFWIILIRYYVGRTSNSDAIILWWENLITPFCYLDLRTDSKNHNQYFTIPLYLQCARL